MSGAFGQTIKQNTLDGFFLTGPGEQIVANTLLQMSSIQNDTTAAFIELFGPYKSGTQQQRWADYSRFDWSIRQLPVINIYEAEPQEKTSSNAWVLGTV